VNIVERFLGQDPALTRNPVLVKNGYLFTYVKMKENIHILENLKQISEVKSNVRMKKSKCLIILDLGKHIYG